MMQSFANGLINISRASSSRVCLRPSVFTASFPRRFYSEKRSKDDKSQDQKSTKDVDEAAILQLLQGSAPKPPPKTKVAKLPTPHAFPSRNPTAGSEAHGEDGPPVGPPGTEPTTPPSKGPTAWAQNRLNQREGNNGEKRKTSEVMNSKYAQYRLYMQAGRNNCILTLVGDDDKVRTIVSAGMCGFRNSQESTYEAGYQCAVRMFDKIRTEIELRTDKQMQLEILLKGFGLSRQALMKALTMTEGNGVREIVNRLTDRTPIKIGGVRAQKARRM